MSRRHEGEQFTPAEWVELFLELGPKDREQMAEKAIQSAEESLNCTMQDHAGVIRYVRQHRCTGLFHPGGRRAQHQGLLQGSSEMSRRNAELTVININLNCYQKETPTVSGRCLSFMCEQYSL